MQKGQRIWKDCQRCLITGKLYMPSNSPYPVNIESKQDLISYTEIECEDCNGLGIKPWGWLRDEKETTMPGEEA